MCDGANNSEIKKKKLYGKNRRASGVCGVPFFSKVRRNKADLDRHTYQDGREETGFSAKNGMHNNPSIGLYAAFSKATKAENSKAFAHPRCEEHAPCVKLARQLMCYILYFLPFFIAYMFRITDLQALCQMKIEEFLSKHGEKMFSYIFLL